MMKITSAPYLEDLPPGIQSGDILMMRRLIADVFQEAQKSAASHRKLVISLTKVQNKAITAGIEGNFNQVFCELLNRILPIKRSEQCANLVVKFCETFIRYIQSQDEKKNNQDEIDTLTTRFVSNIVQHLLKGIQSKDKNVRFRVCQIIAVIINSLTEIDEELFETLHYALGKRLYDKEQSVRVQSCLALSRLQDESEEGVQVYQMLLAKLQNDTSMEVRRAVLLNLEKSSGTLKYLLERARDTHPTIRRAVFSRTMREIGDFRLLNISMREKLLQWGLRDRDSIVQSAAVNMFVEDWVNSANNDLLELLERLDVINSDIADLAMELFFKHRQDSLNKLEFGDDFWTDLTAESVFLARSFNAFCVKQRLTDLIDNKMPDLTMLAERISENFEVLSRDQKHDVELEFIIGQLLMISATYDFGDEIGRRRILEVLRNSLIKHDLTEALIQQVVNVIRKISVSETDFSQVLVELIFDIRDGLNDEDSFHSAVSEPLSPLPAQSLSSKRQSGTERSSVEEEESSVLVKCLQIARSLLCLIENPLESNVYISSVLDSLIIPSVRNRESSIRELGLRCLGLCCLLSKRLAVENLLLFGHCYTKGHEALQVEAIKIIGDILSIHGTSVLDVDGGVDSHSIYKLYYRAIRNSEAPEAQSTAAESLCKLLLSGVIKEPDLVKTLVLIYFDTASSGNLTLIQMLTFCLPTYCFSSADNQQIMASIVVDSFRRLITTMGEGDHPESITPSLIVQQLAEWTNPENVITNQRLDELHIDLAIEIIDRLEESELKEERKALCAVLPKLYIPDVTSVSKLKELHEKVLELIKGDMIQELASKNSLARFKTSLDKLLSKTEEREVNQEPKLDHENSAIAQDKSFADTGVEETLSSSLAQTYIAE